MNLDRIFAIGGTLTSVSGVTEKSVPKIVLKKEISDHFDECKRVQVLMISYENRKSPLFSVAAAYDGDNDQTFSFR